MTWSLGPIAIPSVAVLAPMAGTTDLNFRLLCREFGVGFVTTELVSASCLLRGLNHTLRLLETSERERPVGIQLFGWEPEMLAEAARWVEANTACDLIDLNMGCPVPKVVTKGAGAALMRQPALVERLVRAVVDAVDLPVTAKTRSGWNDREINAVEVSQAVEQAGGLAIAVHARTRTQRHEGPVNWDLLAEIKAAVSIPVIGNGGIKSAADALAMREATGVDAAMIGRGAIGNPWIFRQVDQAWRGEPVTEPSPSERLRVMERHVKASIATMRRWARRGKDQEQAERRGIAFVRGHLVSYLRPAPGFLAFRQQLNDLDTVGALLAAARKAWAADPAGLPDAA